MIDYIEQGIRAAVGGNQLQVALRRHAPDAEADVLADALRPFLAAIPAALRFVISAGREPRAGKAIELASGQVVHYLLDDRDALPESDLGILGLLDDALLLHGYAAQLMVWHPHLPLGAYEVPPPAQFELVRQLLPAGMADAIERTSRGILSVATSLLGSAPLAMATAGSPPALRVDGAVAHLKQRAEAGG